ncbi:MAG: biotin carboxylase N-terminal domain-containing protein, partial [Achromobacter sp.]
MFSTILIANRGEIACRVAATARRMGLRTVAVYSDADADSRHVAACDTAIHIGGSEPRQSYLRGDVVLAAARAAGADAIHPGYGFLSENEGFAQSVADAGLIFVGPPPSAIAAMGSKSAAKSLMEKAGVPLVPGYHGDDQDPALLHREADRIGYPVLIKASAGGGGKGMRVVESSAAFADALTSCKREAQASFGDDRVLIERYLQKPRHIEIQVFADTHGNCVHLFERDCSVQRRHQKVIEEAPAPGMTPERRKAMGDAAVAAARAVNYVGAGTVEFIVEPDGRFYFMEMNTRLQVEHPVTEFITGTDLVEWQLRVAAGEPLPATQDMLQIHGHAIEARLYAENPDNGFLPSIGTLAHLALPPHTAFALGELRVDGGVRQGDTISPFYDPMIAKIIVSGADRDQARQRMIQALAATQVVGVQTNAAFLLRLMRDEAFAAADLDTGLIERRRATLLPEAGTVATSEDDLLLAAISQIAAPLRDGMNAAPTGTPVHAGGHAAT